MFNNLPHIVFDVAPRAQRATGHVIGVNLLTLQATLDFVGNRIKDKQGFAIATLNMDHVVKLGNDAAFFQAYQTHDAVTADGFPIVWLGRCKGVRLERTTGIDLTIPAIRLAHQLGAKIAIIGAMPPALAAACTRLIQEVPDLDIAYAHAPSLGFQPHTQESKNIIRTLAESGATLCFIALGSPKQEIFAAEVKAALPMIGFVSIGAGIDFIAGIQKRAPKWVRKINMEWLWRLIGSPRRLFKRYFLCAAALPFLFMRGLRSTPVE